jgi:tRNA-modifying protein YgfZ
MSEARVSPLMDEMLARGGVAGAYHGRALVRRFADPAAEYAAATDGLAVFDRSHRFRLMVTGRAPARMLTGMLTGRVPGAPEPAGDGVLGGAATYHAVLTPKGKMISDLWAFRLGDGDEAPFLLDVPVAGVDGLLAHFGKFLPPRFAAVGDVSERTAAITVSGPRAGSALSRLALGLRVGAEELASLAEGSWRVAGTSPAEGLIVTRTQEIWPEAFTVLGPTGAVVALWKALVAEDATPVGLGVWSTLRVEAGRPVFGTDMDESTIPVEAGIEDRAIDYEKGCYTGQEVIVRIRDRGHVNRKLRLLELGDAPTPARGAELLDPESGKAVGKVTSAALSPRFGGAVALAYVRRGVTAVTLDGRTVEVPADE